MILYYIRIIITRIYISTDKQELAGIGENKNLPTINLLLIRRLKTKYNSKIQKPKHILKQSYKHMDFQ